MIWERIKQYKTAGYLLGAGRWEMIMKKWTKEGGQKGQPTEMIWERIKQYKTAGFLLVNEWMMMPKEWPGRHLDAILLRLIHSHTFRFTSLLFGFHWSFQCFRVCICLLMFSNSGKDTSRTPDGIYLGHAYGLLSLLTHGWIEANGFWPLPFHPCLTFPSLLFLTNLWLNSMTICASNGEEISLFLSFPSFFFVPFFCLLLNFSSSPLSCYWLLWWFCFSFNSRIHGDEENGWGISPTPMKNQQARMLPCFSCSFSCFSSFFFFLSLIISCYWLIWWFASHPTPESMGTGRMDGGFLRHRWRTLDSVSSQEIELHCRTKWRWQILDVWKKRVGRRCWRINQWINEWTNWWMDGRTDGSWGRSFVLSSGFSSFRCLPSILQAFLWFHAELSELVCLSHSLSPLSDWRWMESNSFIKIVINIILILIILATSSTIILIWSLSSICCRCLGCFVSLV